MWKTLLVVGCATGSLLLTACAQLTVQRTDNKVTVNASGSVLMYSMEDVIDRAHSARDLACMGRAAKLTGNRNAAGEIRLFTKLEEFESAFESVKNLAEHGKGVLDIFGSHSYNVVLDCDPEMGTAKGKQEPAR